MRALNGPERLLTKETPTLREGSGNCTVHAEVFCRITPRLLTAFLLFSLSVFTLHLRGVGVSPILADYGIRIWAQTHRDPPGEYRQRFAIGETDWLQDVGKYGSMSTTCSVAIAAGRALAKVRSFTLTSPQSKI
jgi:hypothetical protein